MKKRTILIPVNIGISKADLDILNKKCTVKTYLDLSYISLDSHKDVDILVTSFQRVSKETFDLLPTLKYVITTTAGTDLVDLVAANKNKVKVLNCPTYNSDAVATLIMYFIFALSRRIKEVQISVNNNLWESLNYRGFELKNKTIGFVGYGKISKKVSKVCRSIGMKIAFVNTKSTKKEFEALFKVSDFILINLPLNSKTENIIDGKLLDLMKGTSYLINTSRGRVLNEDYLYDILLNKKIAGAALDVFVGEPKNGILPDTIQRFNLLSNVIVTPHLAFNTVETFSRMGKEVLENVNSIIQGKPINLIKSTN